MAEDISFSIWEKKQNKISAVKDQAFFSFVGFAASLSLAPFLHVVLPDGLDFGDIDVIYMVSFYIADHSVNC